MALGGFTFWKVFDEFLIYGLVRRQGQSRMFMNCHILNNTIVQNKRGLQRLISLRVVQYTRTVTVRISHLSIRTDGKDRQQEVDNSGLWFIERGILHLEFAFLGFCACVGLWFIERGILQLECAFLAVRIVIMRCTLRMSVEFCRKNN